jgi:hypothetical protein
MNWLERLLRKAKGEHVEADRPRRGPVKAKDIQITIEVIPPPQPPEREKWRKVEE